MKKTRMEKGITLIALIITIVVLLILAAVAISSITNDGILSYAQNAATNYNKAQSSELGILGKYELMLEANSKKFKEKGTINGEAYGAYNPIIPAGFAPIDTVTSSWNAEDLVAEVKKGLVISDGTSEFVWIPVEDINEMAKATTGTDTNGRTNYEGMLYNFAIAEDGILTATEMTDYGQNTIIFREPANLRGGIGINDSGIDQSDNASRFITITWTNKLYQENFNKMVESVAKYKGFYVGRYEMSLNSKGKAQSAAGVTSAKNSDSDTNMWWGLYEKATTYSQSGVISEMIWGCQYDAIMKWMQSNKIDITSETPIDTARVTTASRNTTRVTGSKDSNDILNNIYDILGNSYEWTQEAYSADCRSYRGGNYAYSFPVSKRAEHLSTKTIGGVSTRLTLYIET